ncbi:hypothetical protein TKWG_02345 [Advenella kashmirensis WT001]|jgi:bacterioferritin-associated ferredoxin|uniref:Bacterioferritin-associated ferredoxin n=3 Tax=Advenella TaxID=290425 RepID=A0A4Q7VQJ0_9BURK|nr:MULTISPECIES: (2Fe-2S)-binding protein [Advenella]AFK61103.1 hypothetical protein TKWG_02345 [Advenella kashmirensis WT001]RZT98723.1 bacterioferritin-associated ferredoxin [Advenella incenata]HBP31522.1 bacterioferritin [Advenella kashmirensis]
MYICICNAVTEDAVVSAISQGASTLSDLQRELGVATNCGCCAQMACSYLERAACTGAPVAHDGANDHCGKDKCDALATESVVLWRSAA